MTEGTLNPAGPTDEETRCVICRTRQKRGATWLSIQGNADNLRVFAGYFCSPICRDTWLTYSEEEQIARVFGDLQTGLRLKGKSERGELDAEPGPTFFLPSFIRLNSADAFVDGLGVAPNRIARWMLAGWEERARPGGGEL